MTGQENKRPNELIEHAPVTLRRYRAEDVDALFVAVTESLGELRPWMPWAADYSRASAEEYLVDSTGTPQFLVDPGINGTHKFLANGKNAPKKFDAPKATLMSYIIKGILNHKLPWGLVLLGVMISLTLEMSGIPSLAFAVGVYLPLSSSSPIFIGGMIRWLSDLYVRKKYKDMNLTEEQLTAEGDKSPGVLMASGYIAGGAIAGILIAAIAGLQDKVAWVTNFNAYLDKVADKNPFVSGAHADLMSCIPFVVLVLLLYLVGREIILAAKPKET